MYHDGKPTIKDKKNAINKRTPGSGCGKISITGRKQLLTLVFACLYLLNLFESH
jgi:hypothetical protein